MDTCTQLRLRRPKVGKAGEEMVLEITDIIGPAVGERGLELRPDALVGVEIGCISGEVFQVESGMGGGIFPYQLSPVGDPTVPEDDDMSGDVADEMAQEGKHLLLADVMGIELEVEGDVFADRTHRDAGDGAQAIVAQAVEEKGGLPSGCPGAFGRRDEQERKRKEVAGVVWTGFPDS